MTMFRNLTWTTVGLLVAAGHALAQPMEAAASGDQTAALAEAAATEPSSQSIAISNELKRLARDRAGWSTHFAEAYARYPTLPSGLLEAIAFVQTRWVMVDVADHADVESTPVVGLMGLTTGQGATDQVGLAATLLGVSPERIRRDPRWNILAAAALLTEARKHRSVESGSAALLMAYAGFSAPSGSAGMKIDAFARESFAYDVLLALDRGSDADGIKIEARPVIWEHEFPAQVLVRQRAPMVRIDLAKGSVEAAGYSIDPFDETLHASDDAKSDFDTSSTDYGPARWVASPYHNSRGVAASAVTLHTMQGGYAGTISWFQNNPHHVSAHYLIRSSDGQITQMVRESRSANHVYANNSYTLGIEHEGWVSNPAWYTTAMYNASAALTRHFCSRHDIPCKSAYKGAASSGVNPLPGSVKIKGHQHFPRNDHTDPGKYWNWARYYDLLNPGNNGPVARTLDGFENGEGHFDTAPSYSGSTTGISAASSAERNCAISRVGSCSEHLRLIDNPSDREAWEVRFLSGSGSPGANVSVSRNGRIGYWVYAAGTGFSVGLGVDDGSGTERADSRPIAANTWTWVEWDLTDPIVWNPWVDGNGTINSSSVTLDAILIYHAPTTSTVNVYIDEVQWSPN